MRELYIDYPYKKINKDKINNQIEDQGKTYKSPKNTIVFPGNEKIQADIFTVNSKKCDYLIRDGEIFYNIEEDFIEESIDYDHRLDIMQENLANAIVRLCINKLTQLKIADYSVNDKTNKLIISSNDVSYKNINDIENLASYICFANLKIENESDRISIEGYGSISYQGPCLERSGELGLIKIKSLKKNKEKQIEIEIVAGKRALADYREKSNIISNIKNILFIEDDQDVYKEIKKLKTRSSIEDNKIYKKEDLETDLNKNDLDQEEKDNTGKNQKASLDKEKDSNKNQENPLQKLQDGEKPSSEEDKNLNNKQAESKIVNIDQTINSFKNLSTLVGDKKYIYKIIKNMSLDDIKNISNKIMKEKNYIQIYGLENFEESQLVVTRSQNVNINLKDISNRISKKIPIKGYGNIYQVIVNVSTKNLSSAMEAFLINIKNESEKN